MGEPDFTMTANGKTYCTYCLRVLEPGTQCNCNASTKARTKAEKRAAAKSAAAARPDHKHDLPPRRKSAH